MGTTPQIRPIAGCIGAEVLGVDLRDPDPGAYELIEAALLRHHVVVVRGECPDDPALTALAEHFGPVAPPPPNYSSPSLTPGGLYDVDGAEFRASMWHTDLTYERNPMWLGILAARTVPDSGGDTLWANMAEAFGRLSAPLAGMLTPLGAQHRSFDTDAQPMASVHPVVCARPRSGEPVLYVNPLWTQEICGMHAVESARILACLFELATDTPEIVVRHRWMPGDVVIWDMRSTLHRAIDDYGSAARVLRRLSVLGEVPRRFDPVHRDNAAGVSAR